MAGPEVDDSTLSRERLARPRAAADNPLGVRHRRSFIAKPPVRIEPSLSDEGDFPVLTDVLGEEGASAANADGIEKALASILAADMAYSIDQYLAAELPTLVENALLNAREELRAGINETVALALSSFLARRQQLRLPLEDPPGAK
jgi:hypothetical protein